MRPEAWARWRPAVAVLAGLVTLGVSAVVGVAAFLGAGTLGSRVGPLLAAGGCATLLAGFGGGWLVARIARFGARLRCAAAVAAGCVVILGVAAGLTVLRPLPSAPQARRPPTPPNGTRYWTMPDGTRLAYLKLPAAHPQAGHAHRTPVIVVGGGPGEEDVADASQVRFYTRLARRGFDVYLYDQIGAGLSTRLADPRGYTVARHVADLDAIRRHLGARHVMLLGSSWGGSLVAHYMAAHPGRVARAVLTSPAPLDYADAANPGAVTDRLSPDRRARATALLPGTPRFALWYALMTVNPRAAHSMVPDREGDAYFTTFLNIVRPGTVCDPAHLPRAYEHGAGFYDNMLTTYNASRRHDGADVRARLVRDHTPTLIATGQCNYIRPRVARTYAATLPNASTVRLPHAGHVIYLDRPDAYLHTLTTFLAKPSDRRPD